MNSATLLLLSCIVFICQIYFGYAKKAAHSSTNCIESERRVLMDIKRSLVDRANRLSSWRGEDCCNWDGITCNNVTGHMEKLDLRNPIQPYLIVDDEYPSYFDDNSFYFHKHCLEGEINPSISNLRHLRYLDLSLNDFSGIQIPTFLGSMKNLRYLNLANAGFDGEISPHLGNLSNLEYLYLGQPNFGFFYNSLTVKSLKWITEFASLKALDLSGANLGECLDWLDSVNMLPSLSSLTLRGCYLAGAISPPLSHFNLTSLISLDIGQNSLNSTSVLKFFNLTSKLQVLRLDNNLFEGPIPLMLEKFNSLNVLDLSFTSFNSSSILDSLCNITSLVSMDLRYNQFEGSLPPCLGNLTSLVEVYLQGNKFGGKIPSDLSHLKQLTHLDLSYNSFNPQSLPLCLGNLTSLWVFNLANNKFGGKMPDVLGHLKQLTYLDLSYNFFNSSIPLSFGKLTKLKVLRLNNNQLHGAVPSTLGLLTKLQTLDISYNSLTGELFESHFVKLKCLKFLIISSNQFLSLNVSSQWIPPFQLMYIGMGSVHIGTQFPPWLQTQRNVDSLSLRNASISGPIPKWFGIVFSNVTLLDLSDNKIHGSSSGNSLHFVCNLSSLEVLALANNQLTGRIPPCFGNLQQLVVLNLANNSLSGYIPSTLGNLNKLFLLHLNRNNFHGALPSSLKNLILLQTLDVGENHLKETIPDWIGKELSLLVILRFEANKFYGNISSSLCQLSSLQILNLAHNNFVGNIPSCLGNLSGMLEIDHLVDLADIGSYTDVVWNTMKGTEREYPSSLLDLVKSISLSGNYIHGEIPNELMGLNGLQSLNLSNNYLSGKIPEKIGNLKQLESLDLSMNQILGPIPQSLVDIDTLNYLNLSFNNLVGRIPSGNHFDTLDNPFIYEGNSGLCGKLIGKSCPDDSPSNGPTSVQRFDDDSELELPWFYAGIGPGFAVGLLGVLCILQFKKSWRYAYFGFLENVYNKVWVAVAIRSSQFQRKFS